MNKTLSIGFLVKRYIKMRGKTAKEVSRMLGRNYTTFCGVLNRDAVDAKLLFELANLLDMDLEWMSELFGHHKPVSYLAPYQMPRMKPELREHVYPEVSGWLDECIRNNPFSISDARKELIGNYPSLFFLLDVLLPEGDTIRVTVERGKEKYYCTPIGDHHKYHPRIRGRSLTWSYDGGEMLNRIIATRKEEIL